MEKKGRNWKCRDVLDGEGNCHPLWLADGTRLIVEEVLVQAEKGSMGKRFFLFGTSLPILLISRGK